jgi:hypothetical protein
MGASCIALGHDAPGGPVGMGVAPPWATPFVVVRAEPRRDLSMRGYPVKPKPRKREDAMRHDTSRGMHLAA